MRLTNFTVRFHRNMQPAKYEEAGALVEFSGVIEEGDDADALTAERLTVARRQVLASVGRGEEAASEPAKPAAKRTRKSAKAAEKKDPMADAEPAKEPAKKKDPMADDDGPKADTKGGVVAPEEISDAALQEAVRKEAGRLTGKVVKEIMKADHDTEQMSGIPKEKRAEFIAKLQGMKAE